MAQQNNEEQMLSSFEIEMRTPLTKLTVQQEELTNNVRDYLNRTVEQEVAMSQVEAQIKTLFNNYKELKDNLKQSREDIGKAIDDKIDSSYKMTSVTAFIISTIIAILGLIVTVYIH